MTDTHYYLIDDNTTQDDLSKEVYQLGTFSYPRNYVKSKIAYMDLIFTKKYGFKVLEVMVEMNHPKLQTLRVKSSTGKECTIDKFLELVSEATSIHEEK